MSANMEEEDGKRLRIHCTRITKNVRARDVIPYLFEKSVLSTNDMESVTLPTLTTEEGMLKLISLLLKKRGAFLPFCKALEATGSDWLVVELKEIDVSKVPDEPNSALEELEKNEKVSMLMKQLNQQTIMIEMLLTRQKSVTQDSADGKQVPVAEMPELKQAMEENNLSEVEVVKYIDYLGKRKTDPADHTDSGSTLVDRRRSMSATSLNFTETVALKTAVDIVSYLAAGEENATPPKTKYEATMRRTVRELITNHNELFEAYITKIVESDVTGIDFLFNVADEIFRDNQYNWGRIAALYAFCAWLAKHDVFSDTAQPRQAIGEFLGYYVSQKLGHWIDENGGWDSFLDQFPEGTKKKDDFWTMALVGLAIGVGAAATFAIASRQ